MASPDGSILPPSYFDGLSSLWGGCAYVASAVVAAGLVFQSVRNKPDPAAFIWLLTKVFIIGVVTISIREWLMRVNDVVFAFSAMLGVDPTAVDERFVQFITGTNGTEPNTSVWDIIWGTKSIGTAICYAFLWLFGWLSWGVQYIIKMIGGILLTGGWAISPIFFSFFMIRPMTGVAQKYVLGLVALVFWPFGWVMAAVVTNAMLEAAATANLIPVFVVGAPIAAPALTVLLVGAWMIISSILAPWITTKVFLLGANPAAAFGQSLGNVVQATVAGGVGAAVAAVTGGVGGVGVAGASLAGAMASGVESAARGGGSARTTGTVIGAVGGLYTGSFMRRHAAAAEQAAAAQRQRAEASEAFASEFSEHLRRRRAGKAERGAQPHTEDPNQAAIDIDSHVKS